MNLKNTIRKVLKEVNGGSNKLTQGEFIRRSQEKHADENGKPKYDYSLVDFKDTNTKVKVICPEHMEEQMEKTGTPYFEVFPNKHLQGQNKCPFENKRKDTKHTDEHLKNTALDVKTSSEFEIKYPSEYYAARKRDNKTPGFFEGITSHFISESESAGEELVTEILIKNDLILNNCLKNRRCSEREKTFEGCMGTRKVKFCRPLFFDFYIPSLNTVIEYDGEQHFRASTKFGGLKFDTTVENDLIKNNYCKENNINLIRIPYNMRGNLIESELMDALNSGETFKLLGNYPKKGWNSDEQTNLQESIRKVLKEGVKERMIELINSHGLLSAIRFIGDWDTLTDILGFDKINTEMMIKFIKELAREHNGLSVFDFDEDPIFYNKTDTEYREITFFGTNTVAVQRWDIRDFNAAGSLTVPYEDLSNNNVKQIFDFLMEKYENGIDK